MTDLFHISETMASKRYLMPSIVHYYVFKRHPSKAESHFLIHVIQLNLQQNVWHWRGKCVCLFFALYCE